MALANGAMMGVPPDQVAALSLWEYEALLHHWNEAHGADIEPPDPEVAMAILERANLTMELIH